MLAATGFAKGQQAKEVAVPAKVKQAMSDNYPEVSSVSWKKETSNNYLASFNYKETETSVEFDPNGKLLLRMFTVSVNDLPQTAAAYLSGAEPKEEITKVTISQLASGTKMYIARVHGTDYFFDKEGKFVKKTKD